jgi:hypothetical protein
MNYKVELVLANYKGEQCVAILEIALMRRASLFILFQLANTAFDVTLSIASTVHPGFDAVMACTMLYCVSIQRLSIQGYSHVSLASKERRKDVNKNQSINQSINQGESVSIFG